MKRMYSTINGAIRYVGDKNALNGNLALPKGIRVVSKVDRCPNLTSVELPEGVTHIDIGAFSGCTSLERVVLPSTLQQIGERAFHNCALKEIFIPAQVRSISFDSSFLGCNKLERIIVDENNPYFSSIDGVLFNKDKTILLFYPFGRTAQEYDVPDGVETVFKTFVNNQRLRRVSFPDGIKSLGGVMAFKSSAIDEVYFRGSLKESAIIYHPFIEFQGTRIVAPEISADKFPYNDMKTKALLGYAKAFMSGITTGSWNNVLYEVEIDEHAEKMYPLAARDIWMMRYMTYKEIIEKDDIPGIMATITDMEIRTLLIEYSLNTFGGTDIEDMYRI